MQFFSVDSELADMRQQIQQVIDRLPGARPESPPSQAEQRGIGPPDPREEFQGFKDYQGFPRRVPPAGSHISGIFVASTSRVHKALHGIKQTTEAIQNLESQRSKLIAASLADLKYTRNELDTTMEAAEHQGNFP